MAAAAAATTSNLSAAAAAAAIPAAAAAASAGGGGGGSYVNPALGDVLETPDINAGNGYVLVGTTYFGYTGSVEEYTIPNIGLLLRGRDRRAGRIRQLAALKQVVTAPPSAARFI